MFLYDRLVDLCLLLNSSKVNFSHSFLPTQWIKHILIDTSIGYTTQVDLNFKSWFLRPTMKWEYAHICTLTTIHCRVICCNLNLDLNLKVILLKAKGKGKYNHVCRHKNHQFDSHHSWVFTWELQFEHGRIWFVSHYWRKICWELDDYMLLPPSKAM